MQKDRIIINRAGMLFLILMSAVLGLLWAGCSDGGFKDISIMSIQLNPEEVAVEAGDMIKVSAIAIFSNGTVGDISSQVKWYSTDDTTARVTDRGQVWGISAGVAVVVAKYGDTVKKVLVSVDEARQFKGADFVFVSNSTDDTVTVINRGTGEVSSTIPVGPGPAGMALSPDSRFLYVANYGSGSGNTLSVIDTGDLFGGATTVPCNKAPSALAISPGGDILYVFSHNPSGGFISAFRTDTLQRTGMTFSTLSKPVGGVVSPDGKRLYVICAGDSFRERNLWIYDTFIPGGMPERYETGGIPSSMALSPDGEKIYIAGIDDQGGFLAVIDQQRKFPGPVKISLEDEPGEIALSYDGKQLFVAGYDAGEGDALYVFDTGDLNLEPLKVTVTPGPYGVAVDPGGNIVYVTGFNAGEGNVVSMVDTQHPDASVTETVAGKGPFAVTAPIIVRQVENISPGIKPFFGP